MFEPALLRTPRLQLIPCAGDALMLLIGDPGAFERVFELRLAEGYLAFPGSLEYPLEQMQTHLEQRLWWAPLLFVHQTERAVIGLGGYKGPPDKQGVVEVGFSVAPSHQRQGYATEAVRVLVAHAFAAPYAHLACAHTSPELNPSTSVLKKCGFMRTEELFDPLDGKIWRWDLPRGAPAG
jgi:RimJ/RimL family protein N-acetyltransferase